MSTVAPYIFCICTTLLVALQVPAFEVASVKPSANANLRTNMRGGPDTSDPGQITFTNVTLGSVIVRAYDLKPYELSGPDWLSTNRYDIVAKIPPSTSKEQFQLMLQNLTVARFHTELHRETRQIQGYELLVARNGPRFTESTGPEYPKLDAPGIAFLEGVKGHAVITYLHAKDQTIAALAEFLSRQFRIPIVDQTGVTGTFTFTLAFAPQAPGALASLPETTPDSIDQSAPNLLTAIQELGLRFNSRKVPVDVLVIDRADKVPSDGM
jgi:uncharacterized protein (TIGR03435 family)